MKIQYVFEVFEHYGTLKKKEDKVDWLKRNNHNAIRDIIKGSMDPNIKWLLPEGRPPFRENEIQSAPSNLLRQNVKFKYFVDGTRGRDVKPMKRESIFISLLESIHPKDAEIVLKMVEKNPPCAGLTKPIIEEAFPGLLS